MDEEPQSDASITQRYPTSEALTKPATRSELLSVLTMTHLAFTAQSMFHASMLDNDRDRQRDFGIRAVETSGELLIMARKLLNKWAEDDA